MAQTGVGLTLAPHAPSGALRVTALDPEGPAARGGLIQAGDVLFDVRIPSRYTPVVKTSCPPCLFPCPSQELPALSATRCGDCRKVPSRAFLRSCSCRSMIPAWLDSVASRPARSSSEPQVQNKNQSKFQTADATSSMCIPSEKEKAPCGQKQSLSATSIFCL